MREEISEPQHWRAHAQQNRSWSSRRRSQEHTELAADAVDAALAEAPTEAATNEQFHSTDIVSSLANQLNLLEKQRVQLQNLLDQAKSS